MKQRVKTSTNNNNTNIKQNEPPKLDKALPNTETSRVNQFLIAFAVFAPYIFLLLVPTIKVKPYLPYELQTNMKGWSNEVYTLQSLYEDIYKVFNLDMLKEKSFLKNDKFMKLVMVQSIPHVLYLIIWKLPKLWMKLSNVCLFWLGEPYQALAKVAHCIKIFQVFCFVQFFWPEVFDKKNYMNEMYWTMTFETVKQFVVSQHILKYIVLIQFVALGQFLNLTVYNVLGEIGVYYGMKLGRNIPWIYGFPYNTLDHAQYIGATLTILGCIFFMATPALILKGMYGVAIAITGFYCFSGTVEAHT